MHVRRESRSAHHGFGARERLGAFAFWFTVLITRYEAARLRITTRERHSPCDGLDEWEDAVNFSLFQWFIISFLDMGLRAAYSVLINFHPLLIPLALKISLVHLALLIPIATYLRTFELRARTAVSITLIATNILFVGVFICGWIYSIKSGRQTGCSGSFYNEYRCFWVDGSITSSGVRVMAFHTLAQVVINFLPSLIVWPFGPPRSVNATKP